MAVGAIGQPSPGAIRYSTGDFYIGAGSRGVSDVGGLCVASDPLVQVHAVHDGAEALRAGWLCSWCLWC